MTITPRTSAVLVLAREIARRHGHGFVGTEHLLLALIEEGDGIAAQVLVALGAASPARTRTERIMRSYGVPADTSLSPSALRLHVPVPRPSRPPPPPPTTIRRPPDGGTDPPSHSSPE